ncbi:MAG: hypothetical protein GY798_06870 [Hyphomicrobiales bacterium]|nr:hypothetical protein [Hyphomicrobiales bacterium]
MTLTSKIGFGITGLAVLVGGAFLWTKFGSLVYFDILSAAFVGCFF